MKKLLIFGCLLSIILLTSCKSGWGEPGAVHEGGGYLFHCNSGDMTFYKPGEQVQIKFTLSPKDIPNTWVSSDESVAIVDEWNVVTAVGPGKCDIYYTVGDERSGITEGSLHVTCHFSE